jgi:hypothetical protein
MALKGDLFKHILNMNSCLNECLKAMDPFLNCESDTNSFDNPNFRLQTPKYNANVKDIFEATIGHHLNVHILHMHQSLNALIRFLIMSLKFCFHPIWLFLFSWEV